MILYSYFCTQEKAKPEEALAQNQVLGAALCCPSIFLTKRTCYILLNVVCLSIQQKDAESDPLIRVESASKLIDIPLSKVTAWEADKDLRA